MENTGLKKNIDSTNANSKVLVSARRGVLYSICIGTTSAQAITLYDDTNTTTPTGKIIAIKASIVEQTLFFGADGVQLDKGIVVNVPAGYTGDMSINFKIAG